MRFARTAATALLATTTVLVAAPVDVFGVVVRGTGGLRGAAGERGEERGDGDCDGAQWEIREDPSATGRAEQLRASRRRGPARSRRPPRTPLR